jgi:hypothetical protein
MGLLLPDVLEKFQEEVIFLAEHIRWPTVAQVQVADKVDALLGREGPPDPIWGITLGAQQGHKLALLFAIVAGPG